MSGIAVKPHRAYKNALALQSRETIQEGSPIKPSRSERFSSKAQPDRHRHRTLPAQLRSPGIAISLILLATPL
jgi:hypothetical protein